MPSKSPELSNDRLNSSYFLFCCHRKEFTASSRESPVSRAGGRLAEQKAGGRMPDAPAMDETWISFVACSNKIEEKAIWIHYDIPTATAFLATGHTLHL